MRFFSQAIVAIALLHVASCGANESAGLVRGDAASFLIFKDGMNVPCASVLEVERIEVTVFATDGVTKRPGFPRDGDCHLGQVSLHGLDEGDHVLEIVARGKVLGADDAVLFKAKTPISTPSSGVDLSLRPEVAFLELTWTFQDSGFGPCAGEVGEVEVLLAASTGQRVSFNQRAQCMETPMIIPVPLPVLNYTIRVDAYSPEEFPVYTATVQRVLERGENALSMTLMPLGSTVYLDWQFEIGSLSIRACDDDLVMATSIDVTIGDVNSSDPAMETIGCKADRPEPFRGDRFPAGRNLQIDIVAEGISRFRGQTMVSTTGEDLYVPIIVLEAVGTSSLAFTVETATCATAAYDHFSVAAVNLDEAQLALEQELPSDATMAIFEDLPYGEYEVLIFQLNGLVPVCAARGRGAINGRETAWPAIRL